LSNLLKHNSVNIEIDHILYTKSEGGNIGKSANLTSEADRIIENAQNYAAKLKSYAEKKAVSDYEEAKKSGYKAGYDEATELIENQNRVVVKEMQGMLTVLDENKEKLLKSNKDNIIDLAFRIAEKVINQKLSSDKELFFKIYEKAVKDLVAQKWLKLTISKHEVQLVTSNSDYLLSMVSGAERLEVEVLDDASRGICIVETTEKIVDASVITQLNTLQNATVNI